MLIKNERKSAPAHSPGRVPVMPAEARVLIDCVRLVGVFGFRGSFLKEEHREDDIGRHLEELALPILEDRFQKVTAADIVSQGQCWPAVDLLIFIVLPEARECLAGEEEKKPSEHYQRKTVVAEERFHKFHPVRRASDDFVWSDGDFWR